MSELDPRRHAIRPDLADAALKGRVSAERFAEGEPRRIAEPVTALRRRPAPDAPVDTELLYGEPVLVFDRDGGWCWVQSCVDDYVGYVEHTALAPDDAAADPALTAHVVTAPLGLVFPEPSIKVTPTMRLPMGARVDAGGPEAAGSERFHRTEAGYILAQHCAPAGTLAPDWVCVAETFLGTPYLWGGKSWSGIDCSGLVQLALAMAGIPAPRDSDMQAAELGTSLGTNPLPNLERGDLVFWRGHVGIMLDHLTLLHANGHHHMTATEPLSGTIDRLDALGLPVSDVRRL